MKLCYGDYQFPTGSVSVTRVEIEKKPSATVEIWTVTIQPPSPKEEDKS